MARKSSNTCLNVLASRTGSSLMDNMLSTSVTFVAGTTGAIATHTIATITGTVALSIFGVCTVDVASAGGTIEVGTALSTAGAIAQTTATELDAKDIWHDAAPDSSIELTSVITQKIVTQDVAYTIAGATLTAGAVTFYVLWSPISADGNVVIA